MTATTAVASSPTDSYVAVPVFDRSRRRSQARVRVWTDLGESEWSVPVTLDSGLLEESDWSAAWVGVPEDVVPEKGRRPANWVRAELEVPEGVDAYLHVTALGIYEVFLDGRRVGDRELTPGYTQYVKRVQCQSYDVPGLTGPPRGRAGSLLYRGTDRADRRNHLHLRKSRRIRSDEHQAAPRVFDDRPCRRQ